MVTKVLIIGAAGQIGSESLRASLNRGYPTLAFVRTPSKLPANLSSQENCTVIAGDALDRGAIVSAIEHQGDGRVVDAVIVAAPFGDMRGRRSGYEQIAKNVIDSINEVQRRTGQERKIRLWLMAGSAVLEHPEVKGKYLSGLMPFTFYPEYQHTLAYLAEHGKDINWSMNCPAKINKGEPVGLLAESITTLPLYQPPFTLTRYLPFQLGYTLNTMYNWVAGPVSFRSLGEYMVDNLDLGERLKGKRVGVLEQRGGRGGN